MVTGVYTNVRLAALVLSAVLVGPACADLASDQPGPAPASPAPPASSTATGDCVLLSAISPAPAAPLAVTDLGDGTQRIMSAEGGYSIVVPRAWSVAGTPFGGGQSYFGQAHMSSYDERTVPTPRPEAGMIRPPDVGIRFDVEVWANPLKEAPDAYARRLHIGPDQVAVLPGSFVTLDGRHAYRATIQDERRFQPANAPLITTRQTRAVWLVPTPREDRMLVLYATPAESPLLSIVERAVSTLRVSAPVRSVLPLSKQRGEILQQWLVGKAGPIPGRRVEAKLVTYAEAAVAVQGIPASQGPATPMGILRIDRDPEDLFWVVAVSGPDLPEGRGAPPGPDGRTPPSPLPTTWILYITPATAHGPDIGAGTYAKAGTWPPGFDALPDLCH